MANAVGWLRGKVDPYEAASDGLNANSSWTKSFSGSSLAAAVNRYGYELGTVCLLYTSYSQVG